jgi:hypothetical protein
MGKVTSTRRGHLVARWDRLFEDLEAQVQADASRELRAEVADRTRRERALVGMPARLLGNAGRHVVVRTPAGEHAGPIREVGADWLLLQPTAERLVLIPTSAVRSVTGLRAGSHEPSLVARSLGLGAALRAISRDRAAVELTDLDGHVLTGTLDAVGADHLELAEHPFDELRRPGNVRAVHLVPFDAVAAVVRPGASTY